MYFDGVFYIRAMINKQEILSEVLKGLMRRYQERVPDVSAILEVMRTEGLIQSPADIENDHIAFRLLRRHCIEARKSFLTNGTPLWRKIS